MNDIVESPEKSLIKDFSVICGRYDQTVRSILFDKLQKSVEHSTHLPDIIVHRHDEQAYGEYHTKRVILEVYDSLFESVQSGITFLSKIDTQSGSGDSYKNMVGLET
ncbi:hypothetical protein ES703_123996 [subsurface metagenome]